MKPPEEVLRDLVRQWISKAYLKTHSIQMLLDLISGVAPELAARLNDAALLTPFGVDIRYPVDIPDLSPGIETKAFDLASTVRGTVMACLKLDLAGE